MRATITDRALVTSVLALAVDHMITYSFSDLKGKFRSMSYFGVVCLNVNPSKSISLYDFFLFKIYQNYKWHLFVVNLTLHFYLNFFTTYLDGQCPAHPGRPCRQSYTCSARTLKQSFIMHLTLHET